MLTGAVVIVASVSPYNPYGMGYAGFVLFVGIISLVWGLYASGVLDSVRPPPSPPGVLPPPPGALVGPPEPPSVPVDQTPALPAAAIPMVALFPEVEGFVRRFQPSRRFGREREYQIALEQALCDRFPLATVQPERTLPGGDRVDIDLGGVGIELKVAASVQALQGLPEQLGRYRTFYGPNLIAVIFDDTGGFHELSQVTNRLTEMGFCFVVKRK